MKKVQHTYRLYPSINQRLMKAAKSLGVSGADLVGYLLHDSLAKIENGELIVPTKVDRIVVDYDPNVMSNEGDSRH